MSVFLLVFFQVVVLQMRNEGGGRKGASQFLPVSGHVSCFAIVEELLANEDGSSIDGGHEGCDRDVLIGDEKRSIGGRLFPFDARTSPLIRGVDVSEDVEIEAEDVSVSVSVSVVSVVVESAVVMARERGRLRVPRDGLRRRLRTAMVEVGEVHRVEGQDERGREEDCEEEAPLTGFVVVGVVVTVVVTVTVTVTVVTVVVAVVGRRASFQKERIRRGMLVGMFAVLERHLDDVFVGIVVADFVRKLIAAMMIVMRTTPMRRCRCGGRSSGGVPVVAVVVVLDVVVQFRRIAHESLLVHIVGCRVALGYWG
mmetsp:Transcript_24000/g.48187  ORF Transcript_24000/g.48187 Transcript_24000/m.48187 type:complete len:311 (+) Transcript_24000:725-1657(+)